MNDEGQDVIPMYDDASTHADLEKARENLKAALAKASPEVRQAFKQTIHELNTPENIQEMSDAVVKKLGPVLKLREAAKILDRKGF